MRRATKQLGTDDIAGIVRKYKSRASASLRATSTPSSSPPTTSLRTTSDTSASSRSTIRSTSRSVTLPYYARARDLANAFGGRRRERSRRRILPCDPASGATRTSCRRATPAAGAERAWSIDRSPRRSPRCRDANRYASQASSGELRRPPRRHALEDRVAARRLDAAARSR